MLDEAARRTLVENIVASLTNPAMGLDSPQAIQERVIAHFSHIHPALGNAIAKGVGLPQLVSTAAE